MQKLTPERMRELNVVSDVVEYKISKHAKERYAERIMNKEDKGDINRFIAANEEKIKTDIHKLIHYGECIFTGKQSQKDGKGNVLDVYLNGTWVILVDNNAKVVVTLYKIDLGLDEEFNKTYVSKMLGKLDAKKEILEEVKLAAHQETEMYHGLIDDAEMQIKEYKSMIKNLETMCEGYKLIIDNNAVAMAQASREVADVVNMLISKREF